MTIKALETEYAGHKFRSRLEARWAMFFDEIGIKWEYEPQGYKLTNGECYLPDFWLPKFNDKEGGTYVEVKPEGGDFTKAFKFAEDKNAFMLAAEGPPSLRSFDLFIPRADFADICPAIFKEKYLEDGKNAEEYRMYYYAEATPDASICGERIERAALEATSHRFA
jgi:hypothetical protein